MFFLIDVFIDTHTSEYSSKRECVGNIMFARFNSSHITFSVENIDEVPLVVTLK